MELGHLIHLQVNLRGYEGHAKFKNLFITSIYLFGFPFEIFRKIHPSLGELISANLACKAVVLLFDWIFNSLSFSDDDLLGLLIFRIGVVRFAAM